MTGFLPANNILGQTDENRNVNYTITYTDALGVSYPVTLTAATPNNTIVVNGNNISGYYSESFYDVIYYRNKDDTFTTVNKFSEIDKTKISELIHYFADTTTDITYRYVASANGESKIYEVVVTNNWNAGRDNLLKYVNNEQFDISTLSWLNTGNTPLNWVNNYNNRLEWIND